MTYILDDNDRVTIRRRPLTVTVSGRDAAGAPLPEGTVLLAARLGDAPAPSAVTPRPSMLKLPRLHGPTAVRVLPGQGRRVFPEGTILDLTLQADAGRSGDDGTVVVQDVEVSGLVSRDLLVVDEHDASRLSVTALKVVADKPLGRLSQQARAAARHRLGVERTAQSHDLLVGVDLSSSMAPRIADGSVTAVVDVVVGLSQVIGSGRRLDVALLGDRTVPVPDAPPAELAAATARAIAANGMGCGFRAVPPGRPLDRETVAFVVTDAVPADVAALRATRRNGENRSLVVLSEGRPSRNSDVPTTVLVPPRAGDATEHLLNAPQLLGDLVDGMIAASGVVGR
jgi:hypothetical protein